MAEFVVFTLAGAMGAFGDLAGHERRGSLLWPARSAILGLMGAALGVERDDGPGQQALGVWKVAVGTMMTGAMLRDFHTTQTVPTARIRRPNSRRAALAALAPGDNPVLTQRDYVTDCAFAVAVWGGAREPLVAALEKPHFVLYLGRKSCPLTMPVAPRLIDAETPALALAAAARPHWAQHAAIGSVASDVFDGMGGMESLRWDDPVDRSVWGFRSRRVIHTGGPG
ncbi:type I-E CRISPR-associated protein Cas5/CasD [Xanthobacter sp. TB0136]|uniref:type I-E CRISPR-associated protein Cas5/CasD n=1 Tax=Xanthobacter sp. TB0136 TaxID=3459177 RepID=UPI0040390DDA